MATHCVSLDTSPSAPVFLWKYSCKIAKGKPISNVCTLISWIYLKFCDRIQRDSKHQSSPSGTQLQVQMSKRLTLSIMSKSCFAASCVFMYRGGSKILFPFIKFSIVCSFTFISSKLSKRYTNIFVKRFFQDFCSVTERVIFKLSVSHNFIIVAIWLPGIIPEAERNSLSEIIKLQAATTNCGHNWGIMQNLVRHIFLWSRTLLTRLTGIVKYGVMSHRVNDEQLGSETTYPCIVKRDQSVSSPQKRRQQRGNRHLPCLRFRA